MTDQPNIKVSEVKEKELVLRNTIRQLLQDFKDETGMYVETIYLNYFDSFTEKRKAIDVEFITRLNT